MSIRPARRFYGESVTFITFWAIIFLTLLYFTFPQRPSSFNNAQAYIRFSIYAMVVHLMVAFVPFVEKERINGFWHYNRILFVRFLAAMLFSGVLYAGLALALGSLDFLFDIHLPSHLFLHLFILIAGIFNTWFFLAGIPNDFSALEEIDQYPRGLRIFCQFILLPLVALYLLILYVYAAKILFLWNWPKGIVSYLVAGVSVVGILTLLLIYPYGNLPGNAWIRKFSRLYYVVLLPLVVLLFISIGMRVADYGVTINRYVIIAMGIWIGITSIYFASGRTNIRFIPVSLAAMLVMVSFGFWGMFSVSERSQVKRLTEILEGANLLSNGKIAHEVRWIPDSLPGFYAVGREHTNENVLSDSLHNEIKSILDYLDDYHGFEGIEKWFEQDLDSMLDVKQRDQPQDYIH
ncbi:MAG TPA: DUF4153 domain-containing protein, partial [Chryseosolibacter sp.]|nr:DUF4153 domain-containing protein [Chryseosolibacter sp.]